MYHSPDARIKKMMIAMLTPTRCSESWQALMELRGRQEVIERWLASGQLPEDLQRSLQTMLAEVEEQARSISDAHR
jgi:hypothetical protein